jgi:hypothetical protein
MLFTGLALLLSGNSFSQEKPVYGCYKTNETISIDGKGIETAWEHAEKGQFVAMDGSAPRLATEFRWLWDDQYLYGFFHIVDDNLYASMTGRDDHLWKENVVEFFIDDDNSSKSYIEFEFNPLNTVLDLFVLNKYNARKDIRQLWEWNCEGLKNAVFVKGTINNPKDKDEYWDLEVAIPFSQFYSAPNLPPVAGDEWKIDFCRGEGEENPAKGEYSAWAPPAFHNPLSYGILKFVEK